MALLRILQESSKNDLLNASTLQNWFPVTPFLVSMIETKCWSPIHGSFCLESRKKKKKGNGNVRPWIHLRRVIIEFAFVV